MKQATEHRVQMRWRDLDGLGHVSHVVALVYLEEGRDAELARHGIAREQYVVGRCSVNFRDEIDAGLDSVLVRCQVGELGRSSMTTSELVLDDEGKVLVEAAFTIVLWDPGERRSRPITDEERASLTAAEEVTG